MDKLLFVFRGLNQMDLDLFAQAVAQLHVAGQHFTDYLALLLKERDGIEFSGRAEREILREIKDRG